MNTMKSRAMCPMFILLAN